MRNYPFQKPYLLPEARSLRIYEKPLTRKEESVSRPASARLKTAPGMPVNGRSNTTAIEKGNDLLDLAIEKSAKRPMWMTSNEPLQSSVTLAINKNSKPTTQQPIAIPVKQVEERAIPESVIIHVYDKSRNGNKKLMSVKRDFHCSRVMLLREMKYFVSCMQEKAMKQEFIDIDVHCDVLVYRN
jgi:Domain of unknown function (DUF3342)